MHMALAAFGIAIPCRGSCILFDQDHKGTMSCNDYEMTRKRYPNDVELLLDEAHASFISFNGRPSSDRHYEAIGSYLHDHDYSNCSPA